MTMLIALLSLQDASLDPFYKFKPGTTWTYKRIEGEIERRIEAKAVGEENGRVRLDWREVNVDGTLYKKSTVTWFVKDGVLRAEAAADNEGSFEIPVLKAGAKKDEKWSNVEGESTFLGAVDVKVPAGTYKEALHIRLGMGGPDSGAHIDFHLAPKVGLVKLSVSSNEGPNHFELTEFKEAK